jgi:CRP-like cAMP-binding protein
MCGCGRTFQQNYVYHQTYEWCRRSSVTSKALPPLREGRLLCRVLLVSSFSLGDLSILKPHLRNLHFTQKTVLFDQADRVESVYFPLQSIISLVVSLSTGETIEAGMIGNDGAVGISCALDGKVSPGRAVVQISSDAWSAVQVLSSARQCGVKLSYPG